MQQLHNTEHYRDHVLQNIEAWIMRNVNRPIKGFDQKKNIDGTLYTKSQQVASTRLQAVTIAAYFIARGKSEKEILGILELFC